MNYRWTFFLALIALVVFGWFYRLNHSEPAPSLLLDEKEQGNQVPNYIGKNMQATVFSENGRKEYSAQALKVTYFNDLGVTYFNDPVVYLYDKEKATPTKEWRISATKAILNKQNTLDLEQNVEINNLNANAPLNKLTTAQAEINLQTGDVVSPTITHIFGPQLTGVSQRLVGNLKQHQVTLENQVKTHYEFAQQ